MPDKRDLLRNIHTFPQLIKFLRDEMEWPIESESFEELTFDYTPEELGIDTASAAKIEKNGIKRLRPLSANQPWGIFFVKFEPKRLPVVALRRILSRVVLKKRASANSAERAAWQADDLLFVSNYGEGDERQISFAHFSQEGHKSDLPTLKVLGWDDRDTPLHLDDVADKLVTKLSWPQDEQDAKGWREKWSSAFTLRHREVITTSKALAERLADLAQSIRARVNAVLKIESDKGPLRKLHVAFREALIHDLSEDDFADMYAQTIAYGLLTARVSRPSGLVAENLRDMVPVTNPFLRDLLESFLAVGGRKGKVDFDELGVNDVVQLLRDADMEAVLRDFGDRNQEEDPAIHFYELFLKEYDPKKRVQRGVFYTPRPVVSYIVRSVHELLQTEFGLEDGLADMATWNELLTRHKDLRPLAGTSLDKPFVQILDPAVGTGTFLVETIDVIHKTMEARWQKQGYMPLEFQRLWNEYVPKHLLPRLHGFELMMAPYAIAHMKIGLKLYETGYRFGSDERARIYLTNSLEPASDDKKQREFEEWAPALAHEAQAVNAIKRHQRFTVVVGNPPYAGISSNMSEQAQRIVDAYKIVDGEALNERKLWLQDDYVKFIRTAQTTVEQAGIGVFGFITNHGYLDNPTFRGMRQSLMTTFPHLWVLDCHGNANKKEKSPDGSEDKNIFDIRQGVAICLGTHIEETHPNQRSVAHAELWGMRELKYESLLSHSVTSTDFGTLTPSFPYYFFKPQPTESDSSYDSAPSVDEAFVLSNSGIVTARDGLVLDLDLGELRKRIAEFRNPRFSDEEITTRFNLSENYMWRVSDARKQLMAVKNYESFFTEILYRPFNTRHIFFHPSVVWRCRLDVMRQLQKPNLALITTRQTRDPFGVLATRLIVGHKSVAAYDINSVFPLYVYRDSHGTSNLLESSHQKPNFAPGFLKFLSESLGLPQHGEYGLPKGLTPEDIFHYAYAVFHSPGYRSRYAEFLKVDFPRLPLAGRLEVLRALARLGGELVELHVLESPKLGRPLATYTAPVNPEVEKVFYARGTVWLDKAQTHGFRGVSETVWNFHIGGYQVCEKWLKDRKGRTLSKDEIAHYQKIVVALSETIRIMAEIDSVIDAHGGWPAAFASNQNSK